MRLKPWPGTSYLAAGEDNGRVSIFFTCTGDFFWYHILSYGKLPVK